MWAKEILFNSAFDNLASSFEAGLLHRMSCDYSMNLFLEALRAMSASMSIISFIFLLAS